MRLAIISPYPPSGGTLNEYGFHLVQSFAGKENIEKLYILTNHLTDDNSYSSSENDIISVIPCWRFNGYLNTLTILREIEKNKPDLILMNLQFMTFGDKKIPAALGLFLPWVCRSYGYPIIVLLHNITETVSFSKIGMSGNMAKEHLLKWIGKLLTRIILKADIVGLTFTKYVDIIRKQYAVRNVYLFPHGNFNLPERCYLPVRPMEIKLLAFGKFGTYKRVEILLDALQLLASAYPTLRFTVVIAGTDNPNVSGYLERVKRQYAHLSNVVYTGYVPEDQVEQLFKESTFVVFPYSTTTGSSGILHQAASYGRACIFPHIDDLMRLVSEEGYDGECFDVDHVESLVEAIGKLIDDPDRRRQIEDRNYEAAKGLPMVDLADWYLSHARVLLKKYELKTLRPV
jgi:glycosyltransferase involved in cell wall biosynthesis